MKHKLLAYAFFPALLGFGFMGVDLASAHGFLGGVNSLSIEEVATRHQTMFQNQAQILGISVDELKNFWADGKTWKEIIAEKGIDQAQVEARMKTARSEQMKSQLQSLVSKGIITQAQADKRIKFMQDRLENGVRRLEKKGEMFF